MQFFAHGCFTIVGCYTAAVHTALPNGLGFDSQPWKEHHVKESKLGKSSFQPVEQCWVIKSGAEMPLQLIPKALNGASVPQYPSSSRLA